MSGFSEKGNGGNFRLSARRSIHNHGTDCPFWNHENMGRYGLNTKRHDQVTCSSTQEGTDEVDNVMSKFVRASSPMTTRKSDNYRRNSLNSPSKTKRNTDTDDSDEDSEAAEGAYRANYSDLITNSSTSQSDSIHGTPPRNTQNAGRHRKKEYAQISTKKSSMTLLLTSVIVLVAIIIAYYGVFKTKEETSNIIYDKFHFYNDIKVVGDKYKISDNSILQVQSGIAIIFERQDTGSFIFVYNSGRRNFNMADFNNFVNELASASAKYLRNHTKTIRHVVVDTSNLHVHTDKELMNEYIDDVDKTGVMLVKDLDKVPSGLAMAFHYYCDEQNPLVKKSAIFFTLNMARCSNVSSEKYTHENIEKCLAEKWVKMPQDNIRPLLNRVVNVVIDVTSDF